MKKNNQTERKNVTKFHSLIHSGLCKGFSFTGLLLLLIFLLLPVRYGANDDIGFIQTLSGADGFPSDFSSTVNHLSQPLSYLIYVLYGWQPSVPWYSLTIYLATYLGIALITSVIIRNTKRDNFIVILVLPAFLLYFSHCFTMVTFTSAALLLQLGVFLSLFELVINNEPPFKRYRSYWIFLLFCFLFSYLIRWKLILYFMIFGFPILVFAKKHHAQSLFWIIAVLSLLIIGDRLFFFFNAHPMLKEYIEYEKLRGDFTDTYKGEYHGETTVKALKQAGWSVDDANFFKSWILYDERLFNSNTLKVFLSENNPNVTIKISHFIGKNSLGNFRSNILYSIVFVASLLSIFIYIFTNINALSRKEKLKTAVMFGLIGFGIIFLILFRFRLRVNVPLYAYVLGIAIVFLYYIKPVSCKRGLATLCTVILFVISVGSVALLVKNNIQMLTYSRTERDYVQECLKTVEKNQTNSVLILMSPSPKGGLGYEKLNPFKELSDFTDLKIFPAGYAINSPRYFAILNDMDINGGYEFLKWTVDHEDVIFVLFYRKNESSKEKKYLWESYYNRRVSPDIPVKLQTEYDFRDSQGVGLVFYSMKRLQSKKAQSFLN